MKKLVLAAAIVLSATSAQAAEMGVSSISSNTDAGYMTAINKYLHDDIANQIKIAQAEGQMITASDTMMNVEGIEDSGSFADSGSMMIK
jgi:hypothetical protein